MNENDAIRVIEDLIETCKDGQKDYQDAASHVKRSDLKTFFKERSLERSRFAGELEAELIRLGKPDKKLPGRSRRPCIAPGLIPRSAWVPGTRQFWSRWRQARTMPRKATKRQ